MNTKRLPYLFATIFLIVHCASSSDALTETPRKIIDNAWKPFPTLNEGGVVGERVNLWRNKRLWNIAESDYLLGGFESRPGIHPWQGEHVGKWLHAATLAYNNTGDERLKKQLDETVQQLIATQLPDGYLGTYGKSYTFMASPENGVNTQLADDIQPQSKKKKGVVQGTDKKGKGNTQGSDQAPGGGWDTWTIRYNIYGLLTYEKYFPSDEVVNACKKMGDLLIDYYGEGKFDLSKYGTRQGISSTTLLESIVMLYERTLDQKYLDFAKHIVVVSENNPKLRLMGTMLDKGSVVYPGDGKGYQLMANLLGYLRLYKATGEKQYLQAVLHGWDEIHQKHLLTTGGPWTAKMPYNGNVECFAHIDAFNPEKIVVEGCCDATWIQLNIHLFELTGESKYFSEAEITLLNSVYKHQHTDGIEWCYYTKPNETRPKYEARFHCCGSSEPRGMEMFSSHLAGKINNSLSINSLSPATIQLANQFGGGTLKIEGNYPLMPSAKIHLETEAEKAFKLEFRLPANTSLAGVTVNGTKAETKVNERGFIELNRTWKKGDVIAVGLDFQLKAHVQEGENGKKWVAFTYGPIALAQKISKKPGATTSLNLSSNIADMLSKSSDSEIEFTVKGTDITLIPYYLTGSKNSGSRTYFELQTKE